MKLTNEEKAISRKVLDQALYFGQHVSTFPPTDEEALNALISALRPIVGGLDGLWAAVELLCSAHDKGGAT